MENYIYFDQAASSFPKPESVITAMTEAVRDYSANPGRGGHQLAQQAAKVVFDTRVKLAKLFGLRNPNHVVFYQNATMALNQAIKGFPFQEGDHIITTSFEHNSVRRPLEYVKQTKGVTVTYVSPNKDGEIEGEQIKAALTEKTRFIIVSHGSNVTGAIFPLEEISKFTRDKGITLAVDASQTAGVLPIDMKTLAIDILAFPGHKGLLGPQGTGVLMMNEGVELEPLVHGGTGSYSELVHQPLSSPERFESGTLNTPGIAGLSAGIDEVVKLGMTTIFEHEFELRKRCLAGLKAIEGVNIIGSDQDLSKRLAVISFTIEGCDVHEVATILDQHYQIAVRAGLHCAPLIHETMGSTDTGAIRASFGPYNHLAEVDRFIQAVEEIKTALSF